ncbi:hypothetical protein SDC9_191548 [bioreactor metagenome]|uniref:Uncharacterized protein n=1 Tax=bioreactor metagenome TaxID=1076179 RepID=A0A645HY95_9ZZZZ
MLWSENMGIATPINAAMAPPPTQLCTAVHPQAIIDLEKVGNWVPLFPKVILEKMGNGIPYFVPILEFS